MYIGSFFLYIFLLAGCVFLAKKAASAGDIKFVWGIIIALTVITGLRATSVGIDTEMYIHNFNLVLNGQSNAVYGAESTFLFICNVLLQIVRSPQVLLGIFALITNAFIILRFWELKDSVSFEVTVFCYYASFYYFTLNIVRQFVAIAIIFWATRYIKKKQYLKFALFLLLASLFHQSALLGLIYLVIDVASTFSWKGLSKNKQIVGGIVLLLAFALACWKATKYLHYFGNIHFHLGTIVIVKAVLLLYYFYLIKRGKRETISIPVAKRNTGRALQPWWEHLLSYYNRLKDAKYERLAGQTEDLYFDRVVPMYYLIGIGISTLGFFYNYMNRIGLYFCIFEPVFVARVYQQSRYRKVIWGIGIVLFLLPLLLDTIRGGQGQLPYFFFWQS